MANKPSPILTDGELRIMEVIWDRGPSTVRDIQDRLSEPLEESSIRTFLAILERKGRIVRRKVGRAFEYDAVADRAQARHRAVRQLIGRLFTNPADLVLNVIKSEELSQAELEELRKAIAAARPRAR